MALAEANTAFEDLTEKYYSTNSSQLNLNQIIEADARKGTIWKITPTAGRTAWEAGGQGVKGDLGKGYQQEHD